MIAQMDADVREANGDPSVIYDKKLLKNWATGIFNICYDPESLHHYPEQIKIQRTSPIWDWKRYQLYDDKTTEAQLGEEVPILSAYHEGCVKTVLVNRYERDERARKACKKHHGTSCVICGFDFEAVYGDFMKGFIHVHHLKPLSAIKADYVVNPIDDLRPVCPNCHAAIHQGGETRSVADIKQLLVAKAGLGV